MCKYFYSCVTLSASKGAFLVQSREVEAGCVCVLLIIQFFFPCILLLLLLLLLLFLLLLYTVSSNLFSLYSIPMLLLAPPLMNNQK